MTNVRAWRHYWNSHVGTESKGACQNEETRPKPREGQSLIESGAFACDLSGPTCRSGMTVYCFLIVTTPVKGQGVDSGGELWHPFAHARRAVQLAGRLA